jgi:hypothetical protein
LSQPCQQFGRGVFIHTAIIRKFGVLTRVIILPPPSTLATLSDARNLRKYSSDLIERVKAGAISIQLLLANSAPRSKY